MRRRIPGCLLPALWIVGLAPQTLSASQDWPGVVHPHLLARAQMSPQDTVLVWVFFTDKGPPSPEARARAVAAANGKARRLHLQPEAAADDRDWPVYEPYAEEVARAGARVRHRSRWLNGVSALISAKDVERLARLAFVRRIQPVLGGRIPPVPEEPLPRGLSPGFPLSPTSRQPLDYGLSYGQLEQIRVPALHALGFTGHGVRVAILDTGFWLDHRALRSRRVLAERDFIFGDMETRNQAGDHPQQHDHGTGVFGTLGGFLSGGLIGPAFGAAFILAKTEDLRSERPVEEDNWVAAMEWADSLGAQVISSSLGYLTFDDSTGYRPENLDGDTAVTTRAADIAAGRGIVVVNAAGNDGLRGPGTLWTPADADSILTVGAVDSSGRLAAFSSRGPTADGRPKPEVVARGVETVWASARDTTSLALASGTSLSTPLVAGTAALLIEAHPDWGPMQVRQALMETARNAASPNNEIGWGLIVAEAAANALGGLRYPLPFSLLQPPDGDTLETTAPRLRWEGTRDPNQPGGVSFRVLLSPSPEFFNPRVIQAGPDSAVTITVPLTPETRYFWKVEARDREGLTRESREVFSFVTPQARELPATPRLLGQNFPNPFSPLTQTEISFGVPPGSGASVHIEIFTLRGQRVRRLVEDLFGPGIYQVPWDGRNDRGELVESGLYVYRLEAREVAEDSQSGPPVFDRKTMLFVRE